MLKLASWNVNSLKVRLEHILQWLQVSQVSVLAIQETKLVDENFPTARFITQGFHVAYIGERQYNGVAIISRLPITDSLVSIPNFMDPQRRVIAATIGDLRLINLYVPNGGSLTSDKYVYKLRWLEKITDFIKEQLASYPKLAVVGDFNIAPQDLDVYDPLAWQGSVLVSVPERQAFAALLALGLNDSLRSFSQEKVFSWWDYRAAAFRRNQGLRIDHILLSKELNYSCVNAQIDKVPRGWARPSDHAPVFVSLDF